MVGKQLPKQKNLKSPIAKSAKENQLNLIKLLGNELDKAVNTVYRGVDYVKNKTDVTNIRYTHLLYQGVIFII